MKTIQIGDRLVGDGQPCFIVAEAGVNHNGRLDLAKKLVEIAAVAGADAVKFQKRTIEDILIHEMLERPYTTPTSLGATYGQHRQKLELSNEDYWELLTHCRERGIMFLASAWDMKSADFLEDLGMPAFKVASADLTNLPLLEHIAKKKRPMIVSTGMSTLDEVEEAVNTIRDFHNELILLHCVSTYPCENEEVNLRVIKTLRDTFDVPVGYSGHERGIAIPVAAALCGAVVLEKHFTVDRTMPGPDHAASLELQGLERLVRYIRIIEKSMGSSEKRILESEKPVRDRLAKSIVAKCDIPRGTLITEDMLTVKGPGNGLKPSHLGLLCDRVARIDIKRDTLIPKEALEW